MEKIPKRECSSKDTINATELMILNLIEDKPGIDRLEISRIIKKSRTTVARYVTNLKNRNFIEFKGPSKTGGYYLTTKDKTE